MRVYIVFSALVILGLLTLLLATRLGTDSAYYPYLDEFASTLIIGGTLSLLYKVFIEVDMHRRMRDMMGIHKSVDESGLSQIYRDTKAFDYAPMIKSASSFSLIFNDAKRWVGMYALELEKRFSKTGTVTEFFLTDPDGPFLEVLARKTNVTPDELREKLRQTATIIKESLERSEQCGRVMIYALKNYPTRATVVTEDKAVVASYQMCSHRTITPLFVYAKANSPNNLYDFLYDDLNEIRQESKLVFDSQLDKKASDGSAKGDDMLPEKPANKG